MSKRCSPHAPHDLKEDQILSVQDRYDNEEDSDQKAKKEHHSLDDHACREEIRASGPHSFHHVQHPTNQHRTPTPPSDHSEG